jgi:short-subunit dehydrogenase
MTTSVLVLGSNGGIGSSICHILKSQQEFSLTEYTRTDLDISNPEEIFQKDFSSYDLIINCTGHSKGTYQGFLKNSWRNQLDQIMTNYVGNLFVLKHYANSRKRGKYIWISTSLLDQSRPFHSVYAGTKAASKFSIDLIRQEATHIDILEIKVGPTKTKFRETNFLGTKSAKEVNEMYRQEQALDSNYVAEKIINAIDSNIKEIYIK